MKSASERRCRRRKGGGQTGRGKQDRANAACFKYPGVSDSSSHAFKFCIYHFTHVYSAPTVCQTLYQGSEKDMHGQGAHILPCVCVCVCVCVFVHACVHTGSIFKALSLGFSMEYLTSWMPILCAAWVRVFLGCFPFLHGPFSFCILVSA